MLFLIFRTCEVCQKVFKSEKGLKAHAGKGGKATNCHRLQNVKNRAEKIESNQMRKIQAKKQKASKVDLSTWDGLIPRATQYTKLAKTLCLNLISVSFLVLLFRFKGCSKPIFFFFFLYFDVENAHCENCN